METFVNMAAYDAIAGEYYDDFHKTCRNFDEATKVALQTIQYRIPKHGLVLDVGSGRGRCKEYLGIDTDRVVQLDNSTVMLKIQPRESSLLRVVHCAESLPFLDNTFCCVTAFLCDTFIGLNFLSEACRVIEQGGIFVGTTPSYEWGIALREELSIDFSKTRFITKNGNTITLSSILVRESQLIEMLTVAGFEKNNVEVNRDKLPQDVATVSNDIKLPAEKLGCSVYDIDIIYRMIAKK